ncbi:MAG: glycoside hydrolase family 28 protein [Clostridiales bacterium]|nr:glycoside hydrolase family 28 protein [Clostridiales bacterium]
MIRLLFASGTSACFEMENASPYYAPQSYAVYLDGKKQFDSKINVFSLFDLAPATCYRVTVKTDHGDETLAFETKAEAFAADVRQFGAVGDGVHDDTDAVQTALHFLPDYSRLVFPTGVYLCRPLALRSHITLELQEGAVLLGCPDRARYPILPGTVCDLNGGKDLITGAFEGIARPMYQSLIHAENCEDIVITGRGTVDGNAQNSDFWTEFRNFETARPRLMFFCRCKGVTVHGVTGKNSPSWNLHPFYSEDVSFYDMAVEAPKDSPNTDAIDPEGCDGVNIIGCRLSVGDDCIAIKSGKIELCRMEKSPAARHVIRNCLMAFGHGAVTLGSETASGVVDLTVNRCVFKATDRGLRIKTRRGRGKDCFISGILFENILMEQVITPVVINMWYNCCDPDRFSDYVKCRTPLPVDDRTPHLGTFVFRDLTCTGAHAAACYIDGLPEAPIDEVTFERVSISFAKDAKPFVPAMQNDAVPRLKMGLYFNNVRRVHVKDTCIRGAVGGAVIAENCEQVDTDGLREVE